MENQSSPSLANNLWADVTPFPTDHQYLPWEYMLEVDKVNYNVDEELQVVAKRKAPLINIASGVNFISPPSLLVEEATRALGYSSFHQYYDGLTGHALGRRAVGCFEALRSKHGIELTDDQIMVTCGASAAMHLLGLYFGDAFKGSAALIPVPTFPLAGATFKAAGLEVQEVTHAGAGRFLPLIDELEAAITEQTRFIYINLFNNPTGEFYSCQEFVHIVALAKQHNIIILVDRVSSDLDITGALPNVLDIASEQEYFDGIIVVSSLSKDRALPGLRVGWIIGSAKLIAHLAYYNACVAMASPVVGGAILYTDMLCRAILQRLSSNTQTIDNRVSFIAQRFYERVIPLAALYPTLRDFLDPLQNTERVRTLVAQYAVWRHQLEQLLRHNWEILRDEYSDQLIGTSEWKGDFNTFVHIPALDSAPVYETTIALFRQYGLQILPGPVFGLDSVHWRRLGFWTRLSFAIPTPQWRQGLSLLVQFPVLSAG